MELPPYKEIWKRETIKRRIHKKVGFIELTPDQMNIVEDVTRKLNIRNCYFI